MGPTTKTKIRAAINPITGGTVAAAGIGPPGARQYKTSVLAPAQLPNPFLDEGSKSAPLPGVQPPSHYQHTPAQLPNPFLDERSAPLPGVHPSAASHSPYQQTAANPSIHQGPSGQNTGKEKAPPSTALGGSKSSFHKGPSEPHTGKEKALHSTAVGVSKSKKKAVAASARGLAAEDGENDVSNRAGMYDEMSLREDMSTTRV